MKVVEVILLWAENKQDTPSDEKTVGTATSSEVCHKTSYSLKCTSMIDFSHLYLARLFRCASR